VIAFPAPVRTFYSAPIRFQWAVCKAYLFLCSCDAACSGLTLLLLADLFSLCRLGLVAGGFGLRMLFRLLQFCFYALCRMSAYPLHFSVFFLFAYQKNKATEAHGFRIFRGFLLVLLQVSKFASSTPWFQHCRTRLSPFFILFIRCGQNLHG
jgi:hypothetical protein